MHIISLQTVHKLVILWILRLSEDVASVPKHVEVFKIYVQFINVLSAFFVIYIVRIMHGNSNIKFEKSR
jgi:hypothetical protein